MSSCKFATAISKLALVSNSSLLLPLAIFLLSCLYTLEMYLILLKNDVSPSNLFQHSLSVSHISPCKCDMFHLKVDFLTSPFSMFNSIWTGE